MFKNERGITLVALVITIVILIILATVSISIALNQNLIGQAQAGAESFQQASETEKKEITNVEYWVNDAIAGIQGGDSEVTNAVP